VCLDVILANDSDNVAIATGGSCGNVMLSLAYLGWDIQPVIRLGADRAGDAIIAEFKRFGVRCEQVAQEESVGTPIIVERLRTSRGPVPPSHSYSCNCPTCGRWFPRYRPITKERAKHIDPAAFDVYYFDRAAPGTIALAEAMRECGNGIVVFEPSSIGDKALFNRAIQVTDILKYSNERLGCAESLETLPSQLVQIETLGPGGARVRVPGQDWREFPSFGLGDVADTAGAGDWCTAAILFHLSQAGLLRRGALSGLDWTTPMLFAQAMAAVACLYRGARGAMYDLAAAEMVKSANDLARGAANPLREPSQISAAQMDAVRFYCQRCPADFSSTPSATSSG
jgi:fructokinase